MEGAIIGAVLSGTLPKLYSAIREAGEKLYHLKADVESIQSELESIKAAIQDYRTGRYDKSDNAVRGVWIARLRRLAYDIEDLVDRHGAKKVTHAQLIPEILKLKILAEEISKLPERYISPESKQKPQDGASSSTSGALTSHDQGIPGQAGHEVVGMDKALRDLTTLLQKSESPTEGKLKVISIVGFGGIGKTLLAGQVYNLVHHEYPLHAFVNAGGVKNMVEILKEILKQLPEASTSKQDESQHRNDVETQLKLRLGTKRYLIVIDDVHTEERGCDIISAFPEKKGVDSRIIVTTTIQSVAEACSCGDGHVYKMRPLEDDKSEELFFNVSRKRSASEAMKQGSSKIRKKCDGVPLALVSIAQFCKGDLNQKKCEDAWRKLCTPKEEDRSLARMQRVLVNNYETLCSPCLQDCLLYLCMFPHGHPIRRAPLIRRWLAEGPAMGFSSGSDPHGNFETLIDRNLIWPINENVKTCKTPGMMLEYITGISNSENFMKLSCGDWTAPQDIRRLSLHPLEDMRVLQHKDLSRLRTLAVFNEGQEGPLDFAKCKLLRVLDLEACNCVNESHLEQICELLHLLKYLSLRLPKSITKVPSIPSNISNLKLLETLDLGKETVVMVPVEVIELPHLKHLLGKFKLLYYTWGKSSRKVLEENSMLETLAGFVTRRGQGFPPLMRHMRRLTKVKIWCDPDADARILLTPLSEAINEFLLKQQSTPDVRYSLSIDFQQPFPDFRCAPDRRGNLFSLKLRGHGRLTQIPEFVTRVGTITELCLSSTTLIFGDDVLKRLSYLRVLQYLKLEATSSIKGPEQRSSEEGPVVIRPEQLKSLERMCLVAEQNLPWITIQDGALKYLVSLHLICRGLDGLSGVKITDLKALKEVALHSGVAKETKENWEEAAERHPNRPRVLFIEGP
ncbi:disease resistance protein RGA4-like [Phragmites australis]|uniref:disease resistance protein RGA4-like n=1 Tax=Phragmites australis TaxID=29695 RepID=UPI002D7A32DA|nr:disease resistance protein RGA4-like [Phragmites australis]XP_062183114.1 disease resistance protein RGA4-like [Phragmites australis]XP_062183115.1 disease resistance protein RGA4-like [Phragmites australis]XP_062183117.1 disease resistance protein RGA4-like [Phragmites australis]